MLLGVGGSIRKGWMDCSTVRPANFCPRNIWLGNLSRKRKRLEFFDDYLPSLLSACLEFSIAANPELDTRSLSRLAGECDYRAEGTAPKRDEEQLGS